MKYCESKEKSGLKVIQTQGLSDQFPTSDIIFLYAAGIHWQYKTFPAHNVLMDQTTIEDDNILPSVFI